MRKTLFRELFIYNVVIVIFSMVLTAGILYSQLGAFFRAPVYDMLYQNARPIERMSSYIIDRSGAMNKAFVLGEVMNFIQPGKGQGYMIADADGNILVQTGFNEGQLNNRKIGRIHLARVMFGETVASEGNLGGVFNNNLLYVMVPLETTQGVEGAVVVCSTTPYVMNMQISFMKLFFFTVLFVTMLTLIVSAVLSRRIAKPVNEMTVVARRIASGDFSQRVSHDAKGELGKLAASFNQMTVALAEMDDIQSSFISDVSHELRTPMTIISGFVEGVLDGTIPQEEHKKYLEIVLAEIKRLNRLVNDLLEMSRLNSGKIEYKMVPFDITASIRKAIISFEQRLSEKNIDVEVDFSEDSMFVMGDGDSIYRVITNLMDNAVKFTPENGMIKISVTAASGKAKVSIQNSGNGLTKKELVHIWDRFYQTDKSRSNTKKGVGLGLYIVKNIMQAHNNDIYAESEEGKWTRFTFELDSVKNK